MLPILPKIGGLPGAQFKLVGIILRMLNYSIAVTRVTLSRRALLYNICYSYYNYILGNRVQFGPNAVCSETVAYSGPYTMSHIL